MDEDDACACAPPVADGVEGGAACAEGAGEVTLREKLGLPAGRPCAPESRAECGGGGTGPLAGVRGVCGAGSGGCMGDMAWRDEDCCGCGSLTARMKGGDCSPDGSALGRGDCTLSGGGAWRSRWCLRSS